MLIALGCDRHSILGCGSFADRVVRLAYQIVGVADRIVEVAH